MVTKEQVMEVLSEVMDPELHRDIVELGMVRDVTIAGNIVEVTVALTVPTCPLKDKISGDTAAAIASLGEGVQAKINLTSMTDEEKDRMREVLGQKKEESKFPAASLNRVRTIIAVMSGKGGVGKSSVAAMLAVGLRRRGLRVGVLDSDITGPSIPKLFGATEAPTSSPLGIMPPQTTTGIKLMSINLMLQNPDDAVIWRGPMIGGAINQFWNDVFWGDLDTLVVDMPPGTSDAALTVMQGLPVTGIVLVTSPQDLADMVVRKAAHMAEHMNIPLIGVVENMSYVTCPKCGERFNIFGEGNSEAMAEAFGTKFLGKMGIDPEMARMGDAGEIEAYGNSDFDGVVAEVRAIVDAAGAAKFNKENE